VDDVLYRLCQEAPRHCDRGEVSARLALVGRVYAAGLERQVTPPPGKQAIGVIADFVLAHGHEVDDIIASLDPLVEPLGSSSMAAIVEQHGRLTSLLQQVSTDGKAPRSFASKYLHFHRQVVPIFDEYARRALSHLVRWESSCAPFPLPPHGDREYYCIRFLRLYEACRDHRVEATVKMLDTYLWAVPTPKA
jgi:hypothetical protein